MERRKVRQTSRKASPVPRPIPGLTAFAAAARRGGVGPAAIRALTEAVRRLGGKAFGEAVLRLGRESAPSAAKAHPNGILAARIQPRLVWCGACPRTKREILRRMVRGVARIHPEIDPGACLERLLAREADTSTGVGCGIALPHVPVPGLREERVAVATLRRGIRWDSVQKEPVRIVFLVLGSETNGIWRLAVIARIARIVCHPDARRKLLRARSARQLLRALRDLDESVH